MLFANLRQLVTLISAPQIINIQRLAIDRIDLELICFIGMQYQREHIHQSTLAAATMADYSDTLASLNFNIRNAQPETGVFNHPLFNDIFKRVDNCVHN